MQRRTTIPINSFLCKEKIIYQCEFRSLYIGQWVLKKKNSFSFLTPLCETLGLSSPGALLKPQWVSNNIVCFHCLDIYRSWDRQWIKVQVLSLSLTVVNLSHPVLLQDETKFLYMFKSWNQTNSQELVKS